MSIYIFCQITKNFYRKMHLALKCGLRWPIFYLIRYFNSGGQTGVPHTGYLIYIPSSYTGLLNQVESSDKSNNMKVTENSLPTVTSLRIVEVCREGLRMKTFIVVRFYLLFTDIKCQICKFGKNFCTMHCYKWYWCGSVWQGYVGESHY